MTSRANERIAWYVSIARHAPSKHNAQPWRFVQVGEGVELYADATRAMPASDPDERELTIGCGAALRTYALAMRALGYEPVVELLPEGESGPLARVTEGARRLPTHGETVLFAAIRARRTNRGPLDATNLPATVLPLLQRAAEADGALLQLVTAPQAQEALALLADKARRAAALDAAYLAERNAWLRTGTDGLPPKAGTRVVVPYGVRFAHPSYARVVATHPDRPLPAIVWTAGDTQLDWLRAGVALQSVLLTGTVHGVSAGFDNAPLERRPTRVAVRRDMGYAGFPQVVLRLGAGLADEVVPTPRRAVREVLG